MSAPFRVYKNPATGVWHLRQQVSPHQTYRFFRTPGEAIDYAYKHWSWWP